LRCNDVNALKITGKLKTQKEFTPSKGTFKGCLEFPAMLQRLLKNKSQP
jgi:hypothetical protein